MGERVSVHLCTFQRPAELAVTLASLMRQTFSEWDLILVDDSPQPVLTYKFIADLIGRMRLEGHGFKYFHSPIRQGIGKARNKAIELDDWNELCLRVDDDSFMEPDYMEKLVETLKWEQYHSHPKLAAVGGLVPPLGVPSVIRDAKFVSPIFNKIIWNKDGVVIGDDGGCIYEPSAIIPSDHLRSSFLFRKSAALEVGGFPLECGMTGWREETIFCMKLKWAGYELLTDTSAVCWHLMASQGGVRHPQYAQYIGVIEEHFQRWALRKYREHGEKYG